MSTTLSTIIGVFGFAYLKYKHHTIISSQFNLSKYNYAAFSMLPTEIKPYRVFKKCSAKFNKLFWTITDQDKLYYTSDCDELATIREVINRCNVMERVSSLDYFVELFFTSQILGEDGMIIEKLIDNNFFG